MQERRNLQKFYQSHSITIRKSIRQIDMGYDNFRAGSYIKKNDIHILVIGPSQSGKSTLLRTMHYALNGNLNCFIEKKNMSNVVFEKYEIKKNKKSIIEGLSKLKQTDDKLGIFGYELNFNSLDCDTKNQLEKYSRAVQLINNKSLGCVTQSQSSTGLGSINFVIICFSMITKLKKQEAVALNYFIGELQQRKLKYIIVGTHEGYILRRSLNVEPDTSILSEFEKQKMEYKQNWKKQVQKEFNLKLNAQIYCMENYCNIGKKQGFENCEQINYYSLFLLDKCIKKAPESEKNKKTSLKLFCF